MYFHTGPIKSTSNLHKERTMNTEESRSTEKTSNADLLTAMKVGNLDKKLVYHLWETHRAFLRFTELHTNSLFNKLSLTQWRTLNLIFINPGRSQSSLAQEVGITRASMSAMISYFENSGLLERKPSQRRNTYALSITDKGREQVESFYEMIDTVEEEISTVISADNISLAINTLSDLRKLFNRKPN